MKVVCICNPHKVWRITPGKKYDILSRPYAIGTHFIKNSLITKDLKLECIIDDKGVEFYLEDGSKNNIIDSGYFITLEEFRNRKISEILE